jgi:hypothetical protein
MPQCQFLFSAIFVFQKSYTGNIHGIGRNKSRSSYFTNMKTEPKGRRRPARSRPHHRVARPHPWPRQAMVWAPRAPIDLALSPINSLHRENPKERASIHEKYCKPPQSSTRDREGPEALFGILSERGIIIGGLLYLHACLRSDA